MLQIKFFLFNDFVAKLNSPSYDTYIVESEADNDSRTTEVTIIELPWPPTFVRASLVNDSITKSVVVNLTWIPNFDRNIPIERYTIQMKDSLSSDTNGISPIYDDLGWQNKEDISIQKNHTKTWTLLRNLRPFTTYRFRLSTWNQLGEVDELIKKKFFC